MLKPRKRLQRKVNKILKEIKDLETLSLDSKTVSNTEVDRIYKRICTEAKISTEVLLHKSTYQFKLENDDA